MCLWNWSKGICIQQIAIPKNQGLLTHNPEFLHPSNPYGNSLSIVFERSGGLFFLLETNQNEVGGGYRIGVWLLSRSQRLEMISQHELELQHSCLGLHFIGGNKSHHSSSQASQSLLSGHRSKFATLERKSVKIWEYSQGVVEIVKKIAIKQTLVAMEISDLTGFLLLLGENGRILILDQEVA